MGNNQAFTFFEDVTLAAYNRGVLSKELLSDFMRAVGGSDIDPGGYQGTLANDGLDVYAISLKTFGHDVPVRPELPSNYKEWTPEQHEANEDYYDTLNGTFNKITSKFGWR